MRLAHRRNRPSTIALAQTANNASVPGSGTGAKLGETASEGAGGAKTAPGLGLLPIVKLDPARSDAAPSNTTLPLGTFNPPSKPFEPLRVNWPELSLLEKVSAELPPEPLKMLLDMLKAPVRLAEMTVFVPASVSGAWIACEPSDTTIWAGAPPELASVRLPELPTASVYPLELLNTSDPNVCGESSFTVVGAVVAVPRTADTPTPLGTPPAQLLGLFQLPLPDVSHAAGPVETSRSIALDV